MGISVNLHSGWSCDNRPNFIILKSDKYFMEISDLGRNAMENGEITPFYSDDNITLSTLKIPSGKKGVTGYFNKTKNNPNGLTWINIGPADYSSMNPSVEEKAEIISQIKDISLN
jgi:hypothetical protein